MVFWGIVYRKVGWLNNCSHVLLAKWYQAKLLINHDHFYAGNHHKHTWRPGQLITPPTIPDNHFSTYGQGLLPDESNDQQLENSGCQAFNISDVIYNTWCAQFSLQWRVSKGFIQIRWCNRVDWVSNYFGGADQCKHANHQGIVSDRLRLICR